MTLSEVVRDLESLDERDTIYAAEPWLPSSQAIVASEGEEGDLPIDAKGLGLKYFLEVFIAVEFLEGWIASLNAKPTVEAQTARLIEYAVKDA